MSTYVLNAFDQWVMQKAITLAEKGIYTARPNPAVGCIIVKDNQIIGQGYHQKAGFAHAEINALNHCKALGFSPENATVYVTLEPCSHYGKTPPCVNALIKARIKRVIIASVDPNPEVNGIKILKDAGIEVISGCLTDQADNLNKGFLKVMTTSEPYVRLKLAASLDGRTAMASGESKWITSEKSRNDVQKLRARSGAIITGIGTVLADNPSLTVRKLTEDIAIDQPLRVVIDRKLKIPVDANIIHAQGQCAIVSASEDAEKIAMLENKNVDIVKLAFDESLLVNLLFILKEKYAIYDVLVETGHKLAASFLQAGLIDEFWYYIAPCVMGKTAKPLFDLSYNTMAEKCQFTLESVSPLGDDIRSIYRKK